MSGAHAILLLQLTPVVPESIATRVRAKTRERSFAKLGDEAIGLEAASDERGRFRTELRAHARLANRHARRECRPCARLAKQPATEHGAGVRILLKDVDQPPWLVLQRVLPERDDPVVVGHSNKWPRAHLAIATAENQLLAFRVHDDEGLEASEYA